MSGKTRLLLFCLLLLPRLANGEGYAALDLKHSCEQWKLVADQTRMDENASFECNAQVEAALCAGAIRTFLEMRSPTPAPSSLACALPADMQLSQAVLVFLKWADNHPEKLHQGAAASLADAFDAAFCRNP
jgi:hypothetical protein